MTGATNKTKSDKTESLLREGLLKKITPSRERAVKSIETAERYLDSAKKTFDIDLDDMAILAAYNAAFHAARAILFSDGFAERSHYAVCEYLKEEHGELAAEANAFDAYRLLRHSVAYGLDTLVSEEDARQAINFASEFVAKVRKRLKL